MPPDLPPVFIVGNARSGTSILGNFFENNSQCYYFFEDDIWKKKFGSFYFSTYQKIIRNSNLLASQRLRSIHQFFSIFLRKIIGKPDDGHRMTENDVTKEKIEKIEKVLAKIEKRRIVIKNPRNSLRIPFIKKLFPNARFIHIIRDGRDSTCSLMIVKNTSYWSHVKPPGWLEIQKKNPKGPKKYAWQWNSIVETIYEDKKAIPQKDFIEIKYEELVKNPQEIMKNVFKKLEIPFEKPQEDLCKKISDKVIKKNLPSISDKWTKDHSKRIGRYKDELSEEELKDVEKILGKSNALYNYQ